MVLALAFCSGSETPHHIPGFGSAPFYYYSTDLSPIDISFGRDRPGSIEIDPWEDKLTITLPRAYIVYANGYSSKARKGPTYKTLPQRLRTNHVQLLLTYPDGKPYSITQSKSGVEKPDPTAWGMGKDIATWPPRRQSRAAAIKADIHLSNTDMRKKFGPNRYQTYLGERDGFRRFSGLGGGSMEYLYDDGPDDIRRVACTRELEKSNPVFFCTYTIVLNKNLWAELQFIDFRLHGGRPFARERIRVFKKAICPIVQCDELALQSAEVR